MITWYPPLRQLWSFMSRPYIFHIPQPVSTVYDVSTTPSSRATMMDAVLNTEPGSSRLLTARFFISRYSPSPHLVMFTIAFTSPVATSITIATPASPCTCGSFSSSMRARSARSCIPTSIVVMMSHPSTGASTGIFMYLLSILRRWVSPAVPRSIESYANSNPQRAVSLAPNMSPTVRWASEPKGRRRELNSSQWNPPLYDDNLNTGNALTSQYVL